QEGQGPRREARLLASAPAASARTPRPVALAAPGATRLVPPSVPRPLPRSGAAASVAGSGAAPRSTSGSAAPAPEPGAALAGWDAPRIRAALHDRDLAKRLAAVRAAAELRAPELVADLELQLATE